MATTSNTRVLIVDDEVTICEMIQAVLELEGYTVAIAHNGGEALAYLAGEGSDMLITDLAMPDIDGLALITACRERGLDLTAIVMTGYGSLNSAVRALQLGAYDYVLKPFDPPILLAAVARAAERQQLRYELERRKQLEMASQLAFAVRHEINNPLATIIGLAQLHLDEVLSDDMRNDLETINHSARRISEALQRLTELRRLALTDTGFGDGSQMLDLSGSPQEG